jgi:hypothetical protein
MLSEVSVAGKALSLLGSCTLMLLLTSGTFGRGKESEAATLTLSVFNDALVPTDVVAQGEGRAGQILSQAGIQVEWLNCPVGGTHVPDQFERPSPCSSITYPSHLSVRILSSGKPLREDIFGEAFADSAGKGTHINLYYAHLAESGARKALREGELLGYVIAHEVGHLLLGTDSHYHEGIMQRRWEQAELRDAARGKLQFTAAQAAAMRECLAGDVRGQEQRRSTCD